MTGSDAGPQPIPEDQRHKTRIAVEPPGPRPVFAAGGRTAPRPRAKPPGEDTAPGPAQAAGADAPVDPEASATDDADNAADDFLPPSQPIFAAALGRVTPRKRASEPPAQAPAASPPAARRASPPPKTAEATPGSPARQHPTATPLLQPEGPVFAASLAFIPPRARRTKAVGPADLGGAGKPDALAPAASARTPGADIGASEGLPTRDTVRRDGLAAGTAPAAPPATEQGATFIAPDQGDTAPFSAQISHAALSPTSWLGAGASVARLGVRGLLRLPGMVRPPRFGAPKLLARGVVLALAIGVGAISVVGLSVAGLFFLAGYVALPHAGFTRSTLGYAQELETGQRWLGFRSGSPRAEAADNACNLMAGDKLSDPIGFNCERDRIARTIFAFYMNHETWSFRPKLGLGEGHCPRRRLERVVIDLIGDKVSHVSVDCRLPAAARR